MIASKILTILRGFYFITSRIGPNGFSSYNFVYYTALDVLSAHPTYAATFTTSIAPAAIAEPSLPARQLTLYFLNTTEHLLPLLPTALIESTILPTITLYLTPPPSPSLHPLFESAHTIILALISSHTHAPVAAAFLPYYIDAVFKSFPHALSARQFRLAYTTLIRECSPPHPIAATHANMVDILLELLLERTATAGTAALPEGIDEGAVGLAERDVTVLALVDSLPVMEVGVMERWLDETARLVNTLADPARARERLWEVLSSELDVSRAEMAVRWWQMGGREKSLGLSIRTPVMEQSRL